MNHGHVKRNPDGFKARCGGPALCQECALELAAYQNTKPDGNVHTMQHSVPHIESKDCYCRPTLVADYTSEGGVKHYLHSEVQ